MPMKYGIYHSYIENPERFFAPAKPIITERRPLNRMRRYHASPAYAKPVLVQEIEIDYDRAVQPETASVTFENSQYETWWQQHKHWKSRQRGGIEAHIAAKAPLPRQTGLGLKLVDLSFPEVRPKMRPADRPLYERKARSEPRTPEINFTYIQPKLKTYLEYLKTPSETPRPRTHASVNTRYSETVTKSRGEQEVKSRGDREAKTSRINESLTEADFAPLMTPKLYQTSVEAPQKRRGLGLTLNISPKRIGFKDESRKGRESRSLRRETAKEQGRRGIVCCTPLSIPSPLGMSRHL